MNDMYDVEVPKGFQHMVYQTTIAFRERDQHPQEGPPSKYMKDYVRAAKGVYLVASNICQFSGYPSVGYWMEVMTNTVNHPNQGIVTLPHLYDINHYHAFMGEINGWLVKYRVKIGELKYLLERGRLIRWFNRRRIKDLRNEVCVANRELDEVKKRYKITFSHVEENSFNGEKEKQYGNDKGDS